MNMPQVDTYGTQQPIALLKLLLEKGGMFDRGKDLNWKMFKDVHFIAAMGKVHGEILCIYSLGQHRHITLTTTSYYSIATDIAGPEQQASCCLATYTYCTCVRVIQFS